MAATVSIRKRPLRKRFPRAMLSCRQTSPGGSLPSATRQANFALVRVSGRAIVGKGPGQSTKFLPSKNYADVPADRRLDVVDLLSVGPGDALPRQRLADSPRQVGETLDIRQRDGQPVIMYKVEPVAAQATSPCTRSCPSTSSGTFAAWR